MMDRFAYLTSASIDSLDLIPHMPIIVLLGQL
jgi:hypothetical protein